MDHVTEGSKILWKKGVRILQGNRLAPTDEGHVDELAKHMNLNGEQFIVDMGSGFGEVSWLLSKKLPQAKFWLVNNNEFQTNLRPKDPRIFYTYGDMCRTSIPPHIADLVMFNYSLCLVDARKALEEAERITNRPGKLFVYDYERTDGDNELTKKYLFAEFLTDNKFRALCDYNGWRDVETIHPGGDDTLFREAVGDDDLYDSMFMDLVPVIWKAFK